MLYPVSEVGNYVKGLDHLPIPGAARPPGEIALPGRRESGAVPANQLCFWRPRL